MTIHVRNRRCRWCSRTAPEADLVRIGTTESRAGWCGGPRQGGRPVFMHDECITSAEEANRASRERSDAELAALIEEVRVSRRRVVDAEGRTHERNPLGSGACLGCAQPFPCPAAIDGEQLALEVSGRG